MPFYGVFLVFLQWWEKARTCGKLCVSIRDMSLVFFIGSPSVWHWHNLSLFCFKSIGRLVMTCCSSVLLRTSPCDFLACLHFPRIAASQMNPLPVLPTVCTRVPLSVRCMHMTAPLLTCWPDRQWNHVPTPKRPWPAAVSVSPPASPPATHMSPTALPARHAVIYPWAPLATEVQQTKMLLHRNRTPIGRLGS